MKFKKLNKEPGGLIPNSDKVIIASEEYTVEDRPSYICSFCNQTLIRLTDAGMNNTTFWCRHCSVEFNPEDENLRKESKIVVSDRNIEPSITSVGMCLTLVSTTNQHCKGVSPRWQRKELFDSLHTKSHK